MAAGGQQHFDFGKHAEDWWCHNGEMAMLHRINPLRLAYIVDVVRLAQLRRGDKMAVGDAAMMHPWQRPDDAADNRPLSSNKYNDSERWCSDTGVGDRGSGDYGGVSGVVVDRDRDSSGGDSDRLTIDGGSACVIASSGDCETARFNTGGVVVANANNSGETPFMPDETVGNINKKWQKTAAKNQSLVKNNSTLNTTIPSPSTTLRGLSVLDIGCGGGLLSIPLAQKGCAVVRGIDRDPNLIKIANNATIKAKLDKTAHFVEADPSLPNFDLSPDQLELENAGYDLVLAMEVIEHVKDKKLFLDNCAKLVKTGGALILSTINRNALSFFKSIFIAEYTLNWLPRSTHNFTDFVKPSEIISALKPEFELLDISGLSYDMSCRTWHLSSSIDTNYFISFIKI